MTVALIVFVLALLGGLGCAWPGLLRRLRARRRYRMLARANALSAEQSRWLWELACRLEPQMPERVFVRPSLFDPGGAAGSSAMAGSVRDRLFAD
ncbi:MAG: hypothetical protein KDC98_14430 [Planctomycetes bacterium]|nr:hypothetical protein [Planctomycetota bacterium]